MKNTLLILIMLYLSIQAKSQEGIYYYGVNGKLVEQEDSAYLVKTVIKGIGKKYKIITLDRLNNNEWLFLNSEKILIKSDELQIIRRNGITVIPGKSNRTIQNSGNGIYIVKDFKNNVLIRIASCSQMIPLHFEGMVTEYYPNGNKKSESIYKENMLQSNKNWDSDGKEYVDNIFYSTTTTPTFPNGNDGIQDFIADRIEKVISPTSGIRDELILGAVVMETGTLSGIKIVEGSSPSVNEIFIEALQELPGMWGPATIYGKKVRYFIQLPFSIENNLATIQKFEITKDGRMILLN